MAGDAEVRDLIARRPRAAIGLVAVATVATVAAVAIAALATPRIALTPRPGEPEPVPIDAAGPVERATMRVEVGGVYAFPWTEPPACGADVPVGCFAVKQVGPDAVRLFLPPFEVEGAKTSASGYRYEVLVTREGTEFPLFTVASSDTEQRWVYAALARSLSASAAEIELLQYEGSASRRATIRRDITIDLVERRWREVATVEAEERLTVIGLSRLDAVVREPRPSPLRLNGRPVRFPFAGILHLNLPPGRHEVATDVAFAQIPDVVCPPGTYEGKRMSLPRETKVRVRAPEGLRVAVSARTWGLPESVWSEAASAIAAEPAPARVEAGPLRRRLEFGAASEVRVTLPAVIVQGPNTYAVLPCVELARP